MGKRAGSKTKGKLDGTLLSVTVLLIITGIVMVFSSSAVIASEHYKDMYFFVFRQFVWVMIGAGALIAGLNIDYRTWAKFSMPIMFFALFLLIVVLSPSIGHSVGGARRWIRFSGFGFQPAEMAKVAVVIYMASVLDRKFTKVQSFSRDLLPPLILVSVMNFLIYKQPDFGTSALIVSVVAGMLFLGGTRIKYLLTGVLLFIPPMIYALVSYGYRKERLFSFLNPFENMKDSGFQLAHSIVALGDGGLTGTGLGKGLQKLFFIPEVHTDFVYAVIGQELGFIGTMGVLTLFAVFTFRGIRIALRHGDYLGKVMAGGLTFLISIQTIINIAVVSGCVPTKGLPLPFVSFGGSSLFFNMFAVGIILNISKQ
jgi:cell division protein FtsW